MSFSINVLVNIVIGLQRGIGHQDRLQHLIATLHQALKCDAPALLRYDSRQFIPLAISGLIKDVSDRRFVLEGHPRLETITHTGDMVRFPTDSELPDPYDGLIPGQKSLEVHVCISLPLLAGQSLIGALTPDGMQFDQFDVLSDEELRLIAALAAGTLSNALLIEQLEDQNTMSGDVAPFEAMKQMRMINSSPGMTQLEGEIEIVAASDLNVLISDETRTGKELVTRAIRGASPRAVNPPAYLNCTALPESMVESELFGHVKGVFIGATSNYSGEFEMADNNTLFLDEIGELSLALQVKLLRVLQYDDIQRVGNDCSLRADVRMLAATNRDLCGEVLVGRFHADSPYRLGVFPLSVPLLRKRSDDVILLTGYFCEQRRLRLGFSRVVLSAGTRNLLQHCRLLGSVYELGHAIHRAVVLVGAIRSSGEVITRAQHSAFPKVTLPPPEAAAVPVVRQNLREATEAFQRETVRQALARDHHNWAACARILETGVANSYRLAKRLELKD